MSRDLIRPGTDQFGIELQRERRVIERWFEDARDRVQRWDIAPCPPSFGN